MFYWKFSTTENQFSYRDTWLPYTSENDILIVLFYIKIIELKLVIFLQYLQLKIISPVNGSKTSRAIHWTLLKRLVKITSFNQVSFKSNLVTFRAVNLTNRLILSLQRYITLVTLLRQLWTVSNLPGRLRTSGYSESLRTSLFIIIIYPHQYLGCVETVLLPGYEKTFL